MKKKFTVPQSPARNACRDCKRNASVGCEDMGHLCVAFKYNRVVSNGDPFELQFFSRNFRFKSYTFKRSIEVTGGQFSPSPNSNLFDVKLRPGGLIGCVEIVEKPCGTMERMDNATVLTTVTLELQHPIDPDVKARIQISSAI